MANKNLGIFILIATLVAQATWVLAKEHIVGDDKGWVKNVDYEAWAKGKKFSVGDQLVFKYAPEYGVFYVTKQRYDICCPMGPIMALEATGNNTVTLGGAGDYFFISRRPFCFEGCKLTVTVKP